MHTQWAEKTGWVCRRTGTFYFHFYCSLMAIDVCWLLSVCKLITLLRICRPSSVLHISSINYLSYFNHTASFSTFKTYFISGHMAYMAYNASEKVFKFSFSNHKAYQLKAMKHLRNTLVTDTTDAQCHGRRGKIGVVVAKTIDSKHVLLPSGFQLVIPLRTNLTRQV